MIDKIIVVSEGGYFSFPLTWGFDLDTYFQTINAFCQDNRSRIGAYKFKAIELDESRHYFENYFQLKSHYEKA